MKISIIIPCYNEALTIKKIIDKIIDVDNYDKEIIVIDDGSKDNSSDILKNKLNEKINKLIINDKNLWQRLFY